MRNEATQGQTLIEILVAVGVVTVSLTVLVGITTATVAKNREAKERVVATRMAQEAVEAMRMARDASGWDEFIGAIELIDDPSDPDFMMGLCLTNTQMAGLPPSLPVMFGIAYDIGSEEVGVLGEMVRDCEAVDPGSIYQRGAFLTYGLDAVEYRILVTWKEGSRDPYVFLDGVLKEYD